MEKAKYRVASGYELFNKYYSADKIKKNDVGGAQHIWDRIRVLVGRHEGKGAVGSLCVDLRLTIKWMFNTISKKLYLSNLKKHFVPRSKYSASVLKTHKIMLYREIIAVCSEIHTKHMNIQLVTRSKHTSSRLYKPVS